MAAKDELRDEVKRAIVTRLACYEKPSEVAKSVKDDFGIDVTRQRVEAYDPNKVAGKHLSKEFRDLFEETRKRYLEDQADIGIAQKAFRLRAYERMFHKAEGVGNMVLAKDLLESAAKECGGAYTNKHEHELSGKGGAPLTATVLLTGAPAASPAPEAVGGVPHKGN
jgi:hypothetical protein